MDELDDYCLDYIFAAFFYVFGIYYNKTALILGVQVSEALVTFLGPLNWEPLATVGP